MQREIISTPNAPQAIGTYSQAVKIGTTVYLSGQIPLIPETMTLIEGEMSDQIHQVFKNLKAVDGFDQTFLLQSNPSSL